MEEKKEKIRKKMVVEEIDSPSQATEIKPEEPKEEVKAVDEPKLTIEAPKAEEKPGETDPQSAPKFNVLWIILPGILVLIALLGGIFVYEQGVSSQKAKLAEATPEPTINEEVISSPTPTPAAIDLTKHSISILNGSGIAGEGAKAKTLLETAGFKIASVNNAQTFNFTKTKIQAKQAVEKDFLTALQSALGKSYVVDTTIGVLSSGQKEELIITIGSSKPQ